MFDPAKLGECANVTIVNLLRSATRMVRGSNLSKTIVVACALSE